MAWVHSERLTITYSVKDDDGAKSTVSYYAILPALAQWTQDAINKTMEELWALIDPLVECELLGCTGSLSSYEDAQAAAPAGSDVENKGVYLMTAENNFKADFALPGISESVLVDTGALTGIQIDFSNADVIAFNAAMTSGIDLNPFGIADTVRFTTNRGSGERYTAIRDAYKQNRASFKSRGRRG